MKRIRCLIVDDEKEAREGLFLMLKAYDQLNLVGVAASGLEAIEQIRSLKPDLVFLDIQMPQINGFEVINSLETPLPAFVFVTAFDQYALKAFEIHALDYLVKPFTRARLDASVQHIQSVLSARETKSDAVLTIAQSLTDTSAQTILGSDSGPGRLVIKADGRVYFIDFKDLKWVEAYDYYIKVHVQDRYYLVRETMKSMEARLPDQAFLRVHKSSIVNTGWIHSVKPTGNNDHEITLTDGTIIKSSRSYAEALSNWIS